MYCGSAHCCDAFQCKTPSRMSAKCSSALRIELQAFFALGFPTCLGYASQKISKAPGAISLDSVFEFEGESEIEEGRDIAGTFTGTISGHFRLSVFALRHLCLSCSSRTIRLLKMAPELFRRATPIRNSSESAKRFALVSPETAAATCSSDNGTPPIESTPRSSHSNIRHSRSIQNARARGVQDRNPKSFSQSPG